MHAKHKLPDMDRVTALIREVTEAEILPRFRKLEDHEIGDKLQGEIVTAADIEAEKKLTQALLSLDPKSVVVGEEAASEHPEIMNELHGSAPVWIIDPVDGTRNFAGGSECFAVIVAYCRGGETVAGWIHDPIKNLTVTAAAGEGAWECQGRDKKRLTVTGQASAFTDMVGSIGKKRREIFEKHSKPEKPASFVRYGCTGQEYMALARETIHFAEYGLLKPWDHAAGILIHREAGGYSALSDTETQYKPIPPRQARLLLAPNEDHWHALRDILNPQSIVL